MEMFGGALIGSGTAAALGETEMRRFCNGMFSIYMQVDAFHHDDWFAREVSAYVDSRLGCRSPVNFERNYEQAA